MKGVQTNIRIDLKAQELMEQISQQIWIEEKTQILIQIIYLYIYIFLLLFLFNILKYFSSSLDQNTLNHELKKMGLNRSGPG